MPPYLPRMKFPPWVPDLADQETDVCANVSGVIPRADGWLPFLAYMQFTQALPDRCRGFFFARNSDGTVSLFAGTKIARLYLLDNTTLAWKDVSKGGGYAALDDQANWQFEQFNNFVFAVQGNDNPQVYDLSSSTLFADLGGGPPRAGFIAIVNRFVVLSGLTSGTVNGVPNTIPNPAYSICWCDIDQPTVWVPGTGQADYQELPDGGRTKGVAGF